MGLYFLGKGEDNPPFNLFYLFLTKPVKTPADLAGRTIQVEFTAKTFVSQDLKVNTVFLKEAEVYTALERGVISGFFNSIGECLPYGYQNVTKYYIDLPIATRNDVLTLNLDKWNTLPANLQKLLTDVRDECDPIWMDFSIKRDERDKAALKDAGVQAITFAKAYADWYTQTAFDTEWSVIMKQNPDLGAKFKEMLKAS